jgi:hypothetical protein
MTNILLVHPTTDAMKKLYAEKWTIGYTPKNIGVDLLMPEYVIESPYALVSLDINVAVTSLDYDTVPEYRRNHVLDNDLLESDFLAYLSGKWRIDEEYYEDGSFTSGMNIRGESHPWKLAPRGSINKTPLRVANGYGRMEKNFFGLEDVCKVGFDLKPTIVDGLCTFPPYVIEEGIRLLQVETYDGVGCYPHLVLSDKWWFYNISSKSRGGHGSTGK